MKARTLVIGDIHGGYIGLQQVLERAKITTADILIFLGDYVDGWSQSPEVIDLLIELEKTNQCILIGGNHESLLLKWLITKEENHLWLINGGQSTVDAYNKLTNDKIIEHIVFFKKLKEYYLDSKNRLFIHAGFTNLKGVDYEFFREYFRWDRTLWETAMSLDPTLSKKDILYPKRLSIYSEIFIGHTPVTRFNQTTPMHCANVWNIDTGAAFEGRISIMDINTYEFWQSDNLCELYPNEFGRNLVH